ncbi:ABC transporter permease [Spirochaeta cellobiosiphila]|uniref:ABC transporter permease n=1 Tax=Spirochaeta cellobiosiphila TaxID=504483 RepID=UPI00042739D9|nr:ABC transporter permease subunit [Spirochaeta cellobiosiphila]
MSNNTSKLKGFSRKLNSQKILLLMTLPFVVHIIIFRYIPVGGWIMGFEDYKPAIPFFKQKFVGLKHFKDLLGDANFYYVIRNTLAMATIKLVLGTFFAILTAVLINETRHHGFKRSVQTISYLPHFVSWVVAANIVLEVLSPTGIINQLLVGMGAIKKPILWMGKPHFFWWIIGWSHVWKSVGFGAIIYLAAMTAIDPQLYEAADIDGCSRLRKITAITLPSIKPTIIILLIMDIGHLLDAGFEQQYLLQNSLVMNYSEVFTIYVLRYAFEFYRFSFAAAAGIFKSLVSITLLLAANLIAKKLDQESLM